MNGATPSRSGDQLLGSSQATTISSLPDAINRPTSVATSNSMFANTYGAFANDSSHNTFTNDNQPDRLLDKKKLLQLCKEVDPLLQLDDDLEEVMLASIDDFIENIASQACVVTTARKSNVLEAKDVQFVLERYYGISVPGFGSDDFKYAKRPATSESHKQRMNIIKKARQN